ncbi:2-keto-4-pentenoate hydratase [Rhodopila sp.]|jgi:2-keto-4-pentenoate hydratase|uniref:2-keto-4-pentenoate hydratase n=1 Tax=Rhodopila sp. TaxID=2480087 RepID=UPI002BB2B81B|nr:fumarylacetoacetate hydrolase family protein [Rhodopila sp.]HVZ08220.1 fumarylacetoacetate hydrolase family protein [Rhodopila sp.]
MDPDQIDAAAMLLAEARRQGTRINRLPEPCTPHSVADAHAIQDAVTGLLGLAVSGYKANGPRAGGTSAQPFAVEATRAPIYAPLTFASPVQVTGKDAPQRGVEAEVAFIFHRDLGPREEPYTRQEVAAAVDACAAIELVSDRFTDSGLATFFERLADCVSNAGFVHAPAVTAWQHLDFTSIHVRLAVNDKVVVDQKGGHPTGDPLGVAVELANMMRTSIGVRAGQFVTCGSYTGLRYLDPGDRCTVSFDGLGTVSVTFAGET